jgi:hypothetical protein
MTRLGLLAKTFVIASMAHLKASQLDADAVKPNTIAVVRLYNLSAMKPNAPVKSAWINGFDHSCQDHFHMINVKGQH